MNRDIVISTPARRYARALLEVAIKQRNFTLVLEELENIEKQFQQLPLMKQLFLNPALPQENKRRILEALAKRFGLQPLTLNFLKTLMRHDRLNLLEQVIVSMEQQFLERQGIVVVEVLTARRLDRQEESEMISTLETFTGKKVQLENHVNPGLIGGAVTRIGSTLYDGSVQAQLEQLKTRIIES
jgi:F-type H+-transporting ATPase subunit delta